MDTKELKQEPNYTFRKPAACPRPNGLMMSAASVSATFHYRPPRVRRFDL
ncbi:hypothetical protein [Paraburkholderia rhynchosiae]|nr:hypothetical protein [Paraburkholderia rhynchosiae]